MTIEINDTKEFDRDAIIELYKFNKWSSAEKPDKLYQALLNSHSVVTAKHNKKL